MPTVINPRASAEQDQTGRKLTGRKVLLILLTFFFVVATVDAIMIYFAKTTFRGLDADSPYEVGLAYNKEIAAAREQDKLGWTVSERLERGEGLSRLVTDVRDAGGKPVEGLTLKAHFAHPTDRTRDMFIDLAATNSGQFIGEVKATPGSWDVILEIRRDGKVTYRSKNRIDVN